MKKRVNSIDFFRGIAALSVIMIHTVFHSGNSYVPANIQGWFLLIDIPIFIYLSGLLFAYNESSRKKLIEIGNLIKKWFIFCVICYIYLMIVDKGNIYYRDFVSWLVFNPITNSIYTISLKSSLSFMHYYIIAGIVCSVVIYFIKSGSKENEYYKNVFYVLLFMIFMLLTVNVNSGDYFSMNSTGIGYCIFFLIGFLSYKYKFKNLKQYLITMIVLNIIIFEVFHVNGYTMARLQNLKSVMNYTYVLVSLNSIFTIIFLKDRLKCKGLVFKPINFIGKNAFYMYFAQGINSSLLYLIVPKISMESLALKIITMFLINLSMASLIFIILVLFYKTVDKIINKIEMRVMKND